MVLKNHHESTVRRARETEAAVPGVRVMGGVVLNRAVGGLSPAVALEACRTGARIVWLPTLDAHNHRQQEGKEGGLAVAEKGKVVPEVLEILRILADHDVALATGHVSAEEIRRVVEQGVRLGVRRMVINHPEHRVVNLGWEEQVELARSFPVYFERCYAQPLGGGKYRTNLEVNLEAIRRVGVDSTIIATDSGQMETTAWDEALREYLAYLKEHGVSEEGIDLMARRAPAFVGGMIQERPEAGAVAGAGAPGKGEVAS